MKPPMTPIPGSAQDDVDKLKILFLRWRDLDLTTPFTVRAARREGGGHGWTVTVETAAHVEKRSGPAVSTILADLVAELSRKLILRWRSDGGALQLAGVALEAFDREPEVVDQPDDRDPAIDRRALPAH
jgi:hypothetical protein